MESFLTRYRNITVLLLVIAAQLVLLSVQVKNDRDVPRIRVWTVTAVMPLAHLVEWVRGGTTGVIRNYILLRAADTENRKLKDEVGKLRIENTFLKNELSTADRAKALQIFQANTPSKTLAANVVGIAAGLNSKAVYVNRGSIAGVQRGMAVVTPDGIVGKVITAFPTTSLVLLVTDPEFAAGVIAQKSHARGTLKGQGTPMCKVDYIPADEKVEVGETFYTSGDDRIFPRGFVAGVVRSVRPGSPFQEILVEPTGVQHGVEDVLILIQGVHQDIPDAPPANQPVYIAPPPPASTSTAAAPVPGAAAPAGTEADRLRTQYKAAGDAQGHVFGEGGPGTKPPDFTKLGMPGQPAAPPKQPPAAVNPAAPPTGVPNTAAPPKPLPKTGEPTGAPAHAPAAAPPKPQTKPGGDATAAPAVRPPDVVRRTNQTAGAPPAGGRIER